MSLLSLKPFLQNTRYVVVSGARQKDEEWDPEENGGYAVHGKSMNIVASPSRQFNEIFRHRKGQCWTLRPTLGPREVDGCPESCYESPNTETRIIAGGFRTLQLRPIFPISQGTETVSAREKS